MRTLRGLGRTELAAAVMIAAMGTFACRPAAPPRPVPDPASRRTTQSGQVVGFVGRYGSHVWLGIPYAKPPVGPLRWRAPQPPEPWSGTRDALTFPNPCPQYASRMGGVTGARPGTPVGNEDCLYVNVYAPRFSPDTVPKQRNRLPVMVWIHGGGNSIGESAFYDGGNLAVQQNVIVVTLNYRLGPFGWLRHPALRGPGTSEEERSGNFGTLDHIRALEWVRDNISAFGGDPGRVTIFGESAGGTNVIALLLSPKATGLFHRAIAQSPGWRTSTTTDAENFTDDPEPGHEQSSNEVLLRLLAADGRVRDRVLAKAHLRGMSESEIESYLRAKSTVEILSAYTPLPGIGMIRMPLVFRDGVVLPVDEPAQRLSRPGGYNQVPVILGTNRDENKLFLFADPRRVRKLFWFVPRLRDAARYHLSAEYLSSMWKAVAADELATAMRRAGSPAVFVYRFDWDEEPTVLGADLAAMLGAAHGLEIPFVFGHYDLGPEGNRIFTKHNRPGREELSAKMMSYWSAFAADGKPGRGRDGLLPEWTPWESGNSGEPRFLVFDTADDGGVRMAGGELTRGGLLATLKNDPRLPSTRDKCTILREMAEWALGITRDQYPEVNDHLCADFPFERYPWER